MKAIHYMTPKAIFFVRHAPLKKPADEMHTGIELADNIVMHDDPETGKPLQLISG